MAIRRRLGTALAASITLALLASGCSSDPEPKFADETPSGTPTATSSDPTEPTSSAPTETDTSVDPTVEPEYPEAADGKGRAAAEAFAVYFLAIVDYADKSHDTKTLKRISPLCSACTNLVAAIEDLESEGTQTVGISRELVDSSAELTSLEDRENAVMQITYKTNRYKIVAKDGTVTRKPPGNVDVVLIVSRATGERWRVDDLGPAS